MLNNTRFRYDVESGILPQDIPTSSGVSSYVYPWQSMGEWDSFFIPVEHYQGTVKDNPRYALQKLRDRAQRSAQNNYHKILTKTVFNEDLTQPIGVRVWMVNKHINKK